MGQAEQPVLHRHLSKEGMIASKEVVTMGQRKYTMPEFKQNPS